jgi:hypothetical protein
LLQFSRKKRGVFYRTAHYALGTSPDPAFFDPKDAAEYNSAIERLAQASLAKGTKLLA